MKEKAELRRDGILEDSQEYRDRMGRLPVEMIRHLFWECRCTKPKIDMLCSELGWNDMNNNDFMVGRKEGNYLKSKFGIIIKHWIKYWIYNKKIQEREVRLNEMRIAFDKFRQYLVNQNKRYGPTDFNE